MSALHKNLPLGLALREALAFVGALSMQDADHDAVAMCADLVRALDGKEVIAQVPVVHVLCQACDSLRAEGDPGGYVAKIEALVAHLKRGQNRVITGTVNLNAADPFELESRLVTLHKQMTDAREK